MDHWVAAQLGELTLPAPFSLPLRLFVEAKHRAKRTGLRDVRNAHGVIHDVNEQYSTQATPRSIPMRRHHYRYALFSTSGFTKPAQQFALAQQISLVDLSGPAFTDLVEAVSRTAAQLQALAEEAPVSPFPTGQLHTTLRFALGTWTADDEHVGADSPDLLSWSGARTRRAIELNPARREPRHLPGEWLGEIADDLAGSLAATRGILLGFPAAPFVLTLRADDPQALRDHVHRHGPDVRVRIGFEAQPGRELTTDWLISPLDGPPHFGLRFALPTVLEDWLMDTDGATALRARDLKSGLLSSIGLFLDGRLVRLLFEPGRRR